MLAGLCRSAYLSLLEPQLHLHVMQGLVLLLAEALQRCACCRHCLRQLGLALMQQLQLAPQAQHLQHTREDASRLCQTCPTDASQWRALSTPVMLLRLASAC